MNLAGPQSSQRWAGVYPGTFHFPKDHGPYFDIRDEWYYLAGNFPQTDGTVISVVLSSKRRSIIPPDMQEKGSNPEDYDYWIQNIACIFRRHARLNYYVILFTSDIIWLIGSPLM